MSAEREPVGINNIDSLVEGSPIHIIAKAIRDAARDAQRHPEGSGTAFVDCGGRARVVMMKLRKAGLTV